MKRLRYSVEDLRQLNCLKIKATQLARIVEMDFMFLQINSDCVNIIRGMMTEINMASEKITEASNFNLPEVQSNMKEYNTSVSWFFTEIEWIFKIFDRDEIDEIILMNTGENEYCPIY